MFATIQTQQDPDPTSQPIQWRDKFIENLRALSPQARKIVADGVYFLAWQQGMNPEDRRPFVQHITGLVNGAFWIYWTGAYKA